MILRNMIKAEIITIGDEILIGQIVDSNSAWIAERLNSIGIDVYQITSISDEKHHIINAIDLAKQRADIILLTGGLGPTRDDLTKHTLVEYFNTKLKLNPDLLKHVEELLAARNIKMHQANIDQAYVPENCMCLENKNGTATGMMFEQDDKIIISMPGVPFEMKQIMSDSVLPLLKERFMTSFIVHKTVVTHNFPESKLAHMIEDWEMNLPESIKLAYLPSPGRVRLRLSTKGDDIDAMNSLIDEQVEKLKKIIPGSISSYNGKALEETVGEMLQQIGKTLGTAESCTGGTIAKKITTVPGSSAYFKGSIVAYSNEIKENVLGVSKSALEDFGAVSEQVVREMAEGALRKLNTDYAIATSGIAGPDGGTYDKPVGTTWIAVASRSTTISKLFQFSEHRGINIEKASITGLNMLREMLI